MSEARWGVTSDDVGLGIAALIRAALLHIQTEGRELWLIIPAMAAVRLKQVPV